MKFFTQLLSISILSILVFTTCSSSTSGGEDTDDSDPLIPLRAGNTWTLDNSNNESATATVSGTQVINDQEYYRIEVDGVFYGDKDSQNVYARNTAEGLLIGERESPPSLVQVLLKFPTQDGEIYDYIDEAGNEYSITVNDTTITTPSGDFDCKFYSGAGTTVCMSPKVGLIQFDDQKLTSYEIK